MYADFVTDLMCVQFILVTLYNQVRKIAGSY